MKEDNARQILIIAALVFFSILPYSNALLNDFVFDDRFLILDNPMIKDFGNIGTALTHDYWWGTELSKSELYRPVTIISYIINYRVSGNNPFSFHMVNVILHAITVLLVFYFIQLLYSRTAISFISALLFAVLPIHTEAVTGIVGRAEILMALFLIGALILFILSIRNQSSRRTHAMIVLLSFFLYFLALLSKESAIAYVPITIVILSCIGSSTQKYGGASIHGALKDKKTILYLLGSMIVTIAYLFIRWKVLGGSAFHPKVEVFDNPLVIADLSQRIITSSVIFTKYLALMIFPISLSADYSAWQIPLSTFPPSAFDLISLFLSAIFLFLIGWTYVRSRKFFLPLAVLALTSVIPSNLFMTIGTIFAERLMYLPSLGICLLIALAINSIPDTARVRLHRTRTIQLATFAVATIALLFSARTFMRNFDWRDNLTLFSATVKASPKSARAHGNLGVILFESKRYDEALEEFRIFTSIFPEIPQIHINIANAYIKLGKNQEAMKAYMDAIEKKPNYPFAYYHLGYLYDISGKKEEAIKEYRKAIELDPKYTDPLNNLGVIYLETGKYKEALELFERASQANPALFLPLRNKGEALIKLKDYPRAEEVLDRCIDKNKDDTKSYYLLAYALTLQEKFGEAVSALKKCIELNPHLPDTHLLLSKLYAKMEMEKESKEELRIYNNMTRDGATPK